MDLTRLKYRCVLLLLKSRSICNQKNSVLVLTAFWFSKKTIIKQHMWKRAPPMLRQRNKLNPQVMIPNRSFTKDKKRRDLVKCWYLFDHKLLKCVFSRYTCDVKVLQYVFNFSLQQVCTIWILFTYALLFTHVYCIMYVHSPSWRR